MSIRTGRRGKGITLPKQAQGTLKINANSPWLPEDFVATATVTDLDDEKGTSNSHAMTFQINSQFFANVTIVPDRRYAIRIEAQQISSGLTGSASAEI